MRPSDLKSLKSALEAIRSNLSSLRENIENQDRRTGDAQKTEHEDRQVIASAITSIRIPDNDRVNSERNKERHHGENLEEQRKLRKWTSRAFIAAAIYAGIAFFQWLTMQHTYTEIQRQTKAAEGAAYAACVNAQVARQALIQERDNFAVAQIAATATAAQALAATDSERALIPSTSCLQIATQLTSPFS